MKIFEIKKITNEECEKLCKEQPNFPYIVDDNSLAIVENHHNNHYKIWISQRIEIIKEEDSNDKSIEIKGYTNFGEEIFNISMSMLNKRDFSTLQKIWLFNEKYIDLIIKYILIQTQQAKIMIQYNTVGWFKYKEDLLFRTNKIITDDKDIQSIYQYNGNFQLEPKIYNNDYDLYIKYLNNALVTSGSMFAVVVGLSSALVSLLKHSIQIETDNKAESTPNVEPAKEETPMSVEEPEINEQASAVSGVDPPVALIHNNEKPCNFIKSNLSGFI